MSKKLETQGLVKTIFLIVVSVALLFYFDINIKNTVDSVLMSDVYKVVESFALDTVSYVSEKAKELLK